MMPKSRNTITIKFARPSGDRPSGDRLSGDRLSGDRPSGDRIIKFMRTSTGNFTIVSPDGPNPVVPPGNLGKRKQPCTEDYLAVVVKSLGDGNYKTMCANKHDLAVVAECLGKDDLAVVAECLGKDDDKAGGESATEYGDYFQEITPEDAKVIIGEIDAVLIL